MFCTKSRRTLDHNHDDQTSFASLSVIVNCACSDTCINNGVCSDVPGGGISCGCPCGYDGDRCQFPVTQCCNYGPFSPAPVCLNGGTCDGSVRNAPVCVCPPCWTGQFCEICECLLLLIDKGKACYTCMLN